tara:strand:+ start:78 stop:764 length:687 start_codon:yes stop_codon:yes gene_type:complete
MAALMIIGTAHVIDLSSSLERFIRDFNPDYIALELDKERWLGLQSEDKRLEGPLFLRALAHIQTKIGESFGNPPGSEMLVAANVAKLIGAKVTLIDRPILPMFRSTWRNMPWNEFWNLIKDSLFSLIGSGSYDLNQNMKTGDFSVELEELSMRFPTINSQLIDRRDIFMSKKLVQIFRMENHARVVAVVGEGHVRGMASRLSMLRPKIVNLSDLLERKTSSISFSVEI